MSRRANLGNLLTPRGRICCGLLIFLLMSCQRVSAPLSQLHADDIGRAAMGVPEDYVAQRVDADLLRENMAERREFAWSVLERATRPVSLTFADGSTAEVPLFLTWYGREEFAGMLDQLLQDGPPASGAAGFSRDRIDAMLAATPNTPLSADVFSGLPDNTVGGAAFHAGAGETMFSPAMMTHYLMHAREIANCDVESEETLIEQKAEGLVSSFSPCMAREFPVDAVMMKAKWSRVLGEQIATSSYATDYSSMADLMLSGGSLSQIQSRPLTIDLATGPTGAQPGLIVADRFGDRWMLEALHIVTKEVDEWVWATYWYHDDSKNDFGADRPAQMGAPWREYKMCVQTDFMEQDSSPESDSSELQQILDLLAEADTRMQTTQGVAGFCANPYIEGAFPTETCIGCHQVAGKGGAGPQTLVVPNFVGDFSFAFGNHFYLRLKDRRQDLGE